MSGTQLLCRLMERCQHLHLRRRIYLKKTQERWTTAAVNICALGCVSASHGTTPCAGSYRRRSAAEDGAVSNRPPSLKPTARFQNSSCLHIVSLRRDWFNTGPCQAGGSVRNLKAWRLTHLRSDRLRHGCLRVSPDSKLFGALPAKVPSFPLHCPHSTSLYWCKASSRCPLTIFSNPHEVVKCLGRLVIPEADMSPQGTRRTSRQMHCAWFWARRCGGWPNRQVRHQMQPLCHSGKSEGGGVDTVCVCPWGKKMGATCACTNERCSNKSLKTHNPVW